VSYFDFFRGKQTMTTQMPEQHSKPLVKIQSAK
jgi:hypothetical protein